MFDSIVMGAKSEGEGKLPGEFAQKGIRWVMDRANFSLALSGRWHLLAGEAAKQLKPAARVILSREDCMVNEVHMGVHGDEYQFYIPAQRIEEGGANFMEHA
jgi:hypothetical protein